jgi:hypothetical protein
MYVFLSVHTFAKLFGLCELKNWRYFTTGQNSSIPKILSSCRWLSDELSLEDQGPMLWLLFSAILANVRRKLMFFLKPMIPAYIWSCFCLNSCHLRQSRQFFLTFWAKFKKNHNIGPLFSSTFQRKWYFGSKWSPQMENIQWQYLIGLSYRDKNRPREPKRVEYLHTYVHRYFQNIFLLSQVKIK